MDKSMSEMGSNKLICPNCGKTIDSSIKTCIYCGTSIGTNQVSQNETPKDNSPVKNSEQTNASIQSEVKTQPSIQPVVATQQVMDNSIKEDFTFCPNCGKKNNKNNTFCVGCGTQLKNVEVISSVNSNVNTNQQNEKTKTNPIIVVLLVILSFVIYFIIPESIGIILLLAIISLFNKKTRPYGISIFVVYGIMLITVVVFMFVLFGLCIAMLGG